ncbi:NHLP leader peptide family RiPP precursor [Chryseobacterium arthrosphaerae]|uniref:NHLP leader peptide family RiPP precursor n=1 Tax=Chryseobacterium arthrosphaerae TaxID=651561 RepID=UPI001F4A51D8|nr:NHLP leader peptide family RiPP precursor [Chryseobacterium arthrosphaerae]
MKLTKNQEALQKAVVEAWENAEFKKQLLSSPVEAIESLTGEKFEIPAGKEFVIVDSNDDSKIYFNFPTKESIMEVELTDEQLEAVAGGANCSVGDLRTLTIIDSCFCTGDTILSNN